MPVSSTDLATHNMSKIFSERGRMLDGNPPILAPIMKAVDGVLSPETSPCRFFVKSRLSGKSGNVTTHVMIGSLKDIVASFEWKGTSQADIDIPYGFPSRLVFARLHQFVKQIPLAILHIKR